MPRTPKEYPELDVLRDRLGTVPDKDIADDVGLSPSIVGRYRRRHGISAYQGYKFGHDETATDVGGAAASGGATVESAAKPAPASSPAPAPAPAPRRKPRRRKSKLDPFVDLLGKVPDAEVAELAGVTSENVRAFRRRHSIEAGWRSGSQSPTPSAQPAAVPAAASASPAAQGYSVTASGFDTDHIIVAADMVEAAKRATEAVRALVPGARVMAIRHLGPAIV